MVIDEHPEVHYIEKTVPESKIIEKEVSTNTNTLPTTPQERIENNKSKSPRNKETL